MGPEAMRHETERVRSAVDAFKSDPTRAARQKMEAEFKALDGRIGALEEQVRAQDGTERELTQRAIADLKSRRELHWTRAQTVLAETQPVKRAEPVAEKTTRAERAGGGTSRSRREEQRARVQGSQRTVSREPVGGPVQFFQRLFR